MALGQNTENRPCAAPVASIGSHPRARVTLWRHSRYAPARVFYEGYATEKVISEKTGKPIRRQYRFRMPGVRAFLLAGIQQDGRFFIVTTEPNASVAPIHDRMPLVLGPGEPSAWLGQSFSVLSNRDAIPLVSTAEF